MRHAFIVPPFRDARAGAFEPGIWLIMKQKPVERHCTHSLEVVVVNRARDELTHKLVPLPLRPTDEPFDPRTHTHTYTHTHTPLINCTYCRRAGRPVIKPGRAQSLAETLAASAESRPTTLIDLIDLLPMIASAQSCIGHNRPALYVAELHRDGWMGGAIKIQL